MKSSSLTISVLSVTALILFIAQFIQIQPVQAETWKDRDYSLVTAASNRAGQTVFVVDNRSGQMAALSWDVTAKRFKVDGVGMVSDGFK